MNAKHVRDLGFVPRMAGLYTRAEMAEALRVDKSTLSRWSTYGGGPEWLRDAEVALTETTSRYRVAQVNAELRLDGPRARNGAA